MPRFAANLSLLFTEVPFVERFAAAAAAGFKAVEFQFPYEYDAALLQGELRRHDLRAVLFNLPPGDFAAGDRGLAADPRRRDEFRAGVARAIAYAEALGVDRLNCLAGIWPAGGAAGVVRATLTDNVRYAADELAKKGLTLVVEHINHHDMPGFCLTTTAQALALLADADRPNAFLQYDMYHAQRMEGELLATLTANLARIGHIQVADNPGRHEPGTGEINYRNIFTALDRLGYQGYVGLEYIPSGATPASLAWLGEYGYSPRQA